MNGPKFLIWSNQQGMWWRANHSGYAHIINDAGRYSRYEAQRIVNDATLNGQLSHERVDPVTERTYMAFDEVMVLAPEDIDFPQPWEGR